MTVMTARQLLKFGVHFEHQTRRWDPEVRRFIFAERNGIYIIDLQLLLSYIDSALLFIESIVAYGGRVFFVKTKKQAQGTIAEQAIQVGMLCVNQRQLGGIFTNFHTVTKRVQYLKGLKGMDLTGFANNGLTKKGLLRLEREKNKLNKTLGSIRDVVRTPRAAWVVDTRGEHLTVDEARKLHIPIVGILNTNCDPDGVDYAVPDSDGAIWSVVLLTRIVAGAVAEGLIQRSSGRSGKGTKAESMSDWERELLTQGDNTATEASETSEAPTETEFE